MSQLIYVTSTTSSIAKIAGAIAHAVRETEDEVAVQAIGEKAVYRALKAVTEAFGYLLLDGIVPKLVPSTIKVEIQGEERTAYRMTLTKQ